MTRAEPVTRNDRPDKSAPRRHRKVTRDDWLDLARDILVRDGVGEVKVLRMAGELSVSRSSFYWYFQNREALLDALLDAWESRSTALLIAHCEAPAANITAAICNFFRCFVNPALFDTGLDFAVREWARRAPSLRTRIDAADITRITAVTQMFARHGYASRDADTRARILYFMQLGYHALEVTEAMALRMSRIHGYIEGFSGQPPDPAAVAQFLEYIKENDLR